MISLGIFKRKTKGDNSHQNFSSVSEIPLYVVTLEEKSFSKFIKKYPLSVVDFWASWCAPCKAMAPRLRRLSKIYNGKVAFGKIDIQENRDVAKQYKIIGIPHLGFFSYGKKITSVTGLKSVGEIKDVIDGLYKKLG